MFTGTIDMHCHLVVPSTAHGCWVHPKFMRGLRSRGTAATLGVLSPREMVARRLPSPEELHQRIHHKLSSHLAESRVDYAAVLAFDGVYDKSGRLEPMRTVKMVTNDAVIAACKDHPKMLFCASINPDRRDWEDELDRVLENGAVMLKWLPSVMGFDPLSRHHNRFYRRVRDAHLPILVHIGMEYALPVINHEFANIHRLEHMLQEGVTALAAHCCGNRPFREDIGQFWHMQELVERFSQQLWFDVSGMASPHRKTRLRNSIASSVISPRLVFGTDFPVPIWMQSFKRETELHIRQRMHPPLNYFDRYRYVTDAMGLPSAAYSRGFELLKPRLTAMQKVL
ncbi:MAG: amidohydrolase family protein [Candidatus Pacebacteria bacterium]|nr:amidohydrolase family protein [Candidatus Paceibacterota bacterium]